MFPMRSLSQQKGIKLKHVCWKGFAHALNAQVFLSHFVIVALLKLLPHCWNWLSPSTHRCPTFAGVLVVTVAGWLCRLAVDAIYTSHSCPIVARCLQIFSFCWGCITATFICRLLWTRLSIVAVELRQPYFFSDFRCRVPAAVFSL